MSSLPTSSSPLSIFQPALAWLAILGFVAFIAICLVGRVAIILNLAFPTLALAVAVFLYLRYPVMYISFAWWLWFLTPWVRRMVDVQSGWRDPSPVLLSPLLAMFVSAITLVLHFPTATSPGALPFLLCMGSVLYSFLVGLIKGSVVSTVIGLLNWMAPMLFGFHLLINWRLYLQYRQVILRTFLWGVLIMGVYGVLQFIFAPTWDRFWLTHATSGFGFFGYPEPLKIRVWSTMHSPQPFAFVLVNGLLLLFSVPGNLKICSTAFGLMSLLLSSARAAWLHGVLSLGIFIASLRLKSQTRIIITIVILMLCVTPLTTLEPFSERIGSRLQTFSDIQRDRSYADRVQGYDRALGDAVTEVAGIGVGNISRLYDKKGYTIGPHDSAFLEILFSLGWLGALPYFTGLVLFILHCFQGQATVYDPTLKASRAIILATYSQFFLNSVMIGAFGAVLWTFTGLFMAGSRYYNHLARNNLAPIGMNVNDKS